MARENIVPAVDVTAGNCESNSPEHMGCSLERFSERKRIKFRGAEKRGGCYWQHCHIHCAGSQDIENGKYDEDSSKYDPSIQKVKNHSNHYDQILCLWL